MKLSIGKPKLKQTPKQTILFVCIENAGRSQMAEGFFNKYAPAGYRGLSAGTNPASQINPLAVEAMKDIGIDISTQKSKEINEGMMRDSLKIINMGCMDREFCPTLFLPKVLDWNLEDPKNKPIERVREIRDEIGMRVRELVTSLKSSQSINV
jgi:arsenate reductase (thioredoxin)